MKSQQNTVLKEGPVNWELIRLKDVIVEIINGFACGRRDDAGIVQIRMNNVTVDGRLIFDKFLRVPIPNSIDIMLLRQGDFLFNNTNSIDLVGKSTVFNEAPFPCTFSNHFTRIRLKTDQIIPEFLLYNFLILWEKNYFRSLAIRHVGQAAVHKKYLMKLKLLLPPLPEQKKIAEILTTVDEAIEKVDGAIQKAERLKKGLMQTLLSRGIGHKEFKETKIGMIPKDWELSNIGSLGDLKYGYTSSTITKDTGIKFLRITDINENEKIEWKKVPFCKINEKEYDKYSLSQGDVLFARIGATTGKTAFVETIIKGVFASYLIKFNKTSKELYSKYFFFFTQSSQYWKQANKKREGQLKKGLNAKMISELKLPLPPLPEQKKIADILSTADHKLELMRERKCKLNRVKKGLMNDLLSGKRRVLL